MFAKDFIEDPFKACASPPPSPTPVEEEEIISSEGMQNEMQTMNESSLCYDG